MLRILLIIAVALAVIIGLQRLTSFRQSSITPSAPAAVVEEPSQTGEALPTAESMDLPASDMVVDAQSEMTEEAGADIYGPDLSLEDVDPAPGAEPDGPASEDMADPLNVETNAPDENS